MNLALARRQVGNGPYLTKRQRYTKRLAALKNEASSWRPHWLELSDYILPRRGQFLRSLQESNKGTKRNSNIINSTATFGIRTLASGMLAGITSPARPWFRLTTPDPDLGEYGSVRAWLHVVEERIRQALQKGNIYNVLHTLYGDLGTFGTAPAIIEDDAKSVVRGYSVPIGQYVLAASDRLEIDTIYREFQRTVAQLVERFGRQACSARVRDMYDRGNYDTWIPICHVIEPNRERDESRADYRGMAFKSCWFESGSENPERDVLSESGFHEFPVVAPRWSTTGEDVYGSSPTMDVLGDIRALQLLEKRKAQVVDKIANPPMKAPSSMRNGRASLLPGDITYVDTVSGGSTFEPAVVISPQALGAVNELLGRHEERINRALFADLWMQMLDSDRRQITATEVAERHEEKMIQLGPVLERLDDELLDPLINRVFAILDRRGDLPPPPQELQGVDLRVEYISIMAQAQKLLGTGAVERLMGFVGNLVAVFPQARDKVDPDKVIDEYGGMLGVKPDLIVSAEDVAKARQAQAQQQQAMMQQQQMMQGAQSAKLLSETDTGGDNALTRLAGAIGGVAGGSVAGGLPQ